MKTGLRYLFRILTCSLLTGALCSTALAGNSDGYPTAGELAQQLRALAAGDHATLASLGSTASGADIPLLIVAGAGHDKVPAILVVGDTGGAQAGAPLVLGMARDLLARLDQPENAGLLDRMSFYFIPLPSPDAYDRLFEGPLAGRQVNSRPADEDFDFLVDEDGFEDLNGDGLITLMRVASASGGQRAHPADPRVLIDADASKDELGEYEVYTEGVDNDGDGQFNEDPPGGVDFSRNFTFNYPYFEAGAGPHQVSEPETRAVADFCFDHPNIAMVLSFSSEENLANPWRPGETRGGARTGINGRDEAAYKYLSELYRDLLPEDSGITKAPGTGWGAGSFVDWAYFHFGRWSLAARPWWPADPPKPEEEENSEEGAEEQAKDDAATEPVEDVGNRGKDDLHVLAWIDYADPGRFVDWQVVEHPDFPGKTVEVGGFSPFAAMLPPADLLPDLTAMHTDYLLELAGLLPEIELELKKVESRGDGVFKLEVEVTNLGYLPTESALGDDSQLLYPLQYTLDLPGGAELLDGRVRSRVGSLAGKGGSQTLSWLIDSPGGGTARLAVYSPSIGRAELAVNLDEAGASNE